MGQSLVLQAFPAESQLYTRIATDPKAGFVFAHLLVHGGWPRRAWAANWSDLDEILDDLATCEQLGSRAEVDRALDDLADGLDEARAGHPGLEGRRMVLVKTQEDIEKQLAAELCRRGRMD